MHGHVYEHVHGHVYEHVDVRVDMRDVGIWTYICIRCVPRDVCTYRCFRHACMQTASFVAERLDLPLFVEPGICEILSTFPPGLLSVDELAQHFPRIDVSYSAVITAAELLPERSDGEAARRAACAARGVADKLGGDGAVLFCGHSASCLGTIQAFGGLGYVSYVSLSHFRHSNEGWCHVGTLGDTSHLSADLARQSRNSAF